MAVSHRRRARTAPTNSDDPLAGLAHDLRRSRIRAERLWRTCQAADEVTSTKAHEAWSGAVNALEIAEVISRQQAHDLNELATKFDAHMVVDGGRRHDHRRGGHREVVSISAVAAASSGLEPPHLFGWRRTQRIVTAR
jgi:hypothetical protein